MSATPIAPRRRRRHRHAVPGTGTLAHVAETAVPEHHRGGERPHPARAGLGLLLRIVLCLVFGLPLLFMFVTSFKPDLQIFDDLGSINAFLPTGDISTGQLHRRLRPGPVRAVHDELGHHHRGHRRARHHRQLDGRVRAGPDRLQGRQRGARHHPRDAHRARSRRWRCRCCGGSNQLPFLGLRNGFTQGWLDTYQVQIIPFIANAFSIFLFYQYFDSIPKELDEAAKVDGAGWFRIYRSIVMPLSGPAIATVAILTFLPMWNQYLWPLMVVQTEELRPVMVGIDYFKQLNTSWGQIMAYATMITAPVLILFIAFQRSFINSMASSGVKG